MFDILQHDTIYWYHQISLGKPEHQGFNDYSFSYLINNETILSISWPSELKNSDSQRIVANVNKFRIKIVDFFRKFKYVASKLCELYWYWYFFFYCYFFKEMHSREFIPFFFFNGSQNWVHLLIFFTPYSGLTTMSQFVPSFYPQWDAAQLLLHEAVNILTN